MSESKVPNEQVISVINILYKQCKEEVERYYAINWRDAKISFGPPVIERRHIRTKEPSFEIPRALQTPIIKECLFPDLTLPD